MIKQHEKFGANYRCLSKPNLTLNPKIRPKFFIFFTPGPHICPQILPTCPIFGLNRGNSLAKQYVKHSTNCSCLTRLYLALNPKNRSKFNIFQISRPHICLRSQPTWLKFGPHLKNNLIKHYGKYGTNNRCLSSLILTLNPKNRLKFIFFSIFRLYL